jgi:hypothetical protein
MLRPNNVSIQVSSASRSRSADRGSVAQRRRATKRLNSFVCRDERNFDQSRTEFAPQIYSHVAFITGAASGIGPTTALTLAPAGPRSGLLDFDSEGLERLSTEIQALGRTWSARGSRRHGQSMTYPGA